MATDPGTLDWLLVGTGDIVTKRVAPALAACPRARLVGVIGDLTRAKAIADRFNAAHAYSNLDEALGHTPARAVYVATPVYRHRPEAIAALEAGKHVLVEKPLGLNAGDAGAIVRRASETRLLAGCAYYRRFFPRFAHARKMLDAGEFGQVVLVDLCYHGWFSPAANDPKLWRVQKSKSGGGPLSDVGSHMLDLLIALFGLPESVFAKVQTTVQGFEVEDLAAVTMKLPGGAIVTGSFSWCSKTWAHRLEIVGTEARLRWDPHDTGPIIRTVGREVRSIDLPSAENVHSPLVQDFTDAVLDGREPAIPVAQALLTNHLMDAVYESGRLGREVTP